MKIDDVEVLVEGAGSETILMIHGWPDTQRLWDGTVAALADRYRCARFSLPGFEAPTSRRVWRIADLDALIERIVDALVGPGGQVILLLHDWGCVIGYQYYVRHPQRVLKIVGVDIGDSQSLRREATPAMIAATLGYQLYLAAAWKLGEPVGGAMTRWMARRMRYPGDLACVGSAMCWPYWMMWFGGWARELRPFMPDCPMLYLYARRKPFMFHARAWLDALVARPGNAALGFDTGHWIMLADPAGFHAAIREWLAGGR